LADRTIGRAFGTMCRLSVVCLSVMFCIVAKWSELKPEVVLATIIDLERCK